MINQWIWGYPMFRQIPLAPERSRVKDCLNVDDPVAANHLGLRFQQIQHQFGGSALIFRRFRDDQVGRHAEHSQSK